LGSSENAKLAFGTVMQGLEELLKRETITPAILKNHFPLGLDIANRQLELLAKLNRREVDALNKKNISNLLKQTAEWEISFYDQQGQADGGVHERQ
jgi:hypothetical protein